MIYVALLRGISPTNPQMANANLRSVFEALGFTNVQTVISSGNVIFETPRTDVPALETQIEAAFPAQLGFISTTIIRSREQVQELLQANPFRGPIHSPASYLTVTFLKHPVTSRDTAWTHGKPYTIPALYPGEICGVTDTTVAKTPDFMAQLEKHYGKDITTRTWKTVERIAHKMDAIIAKA
jgi:uncharacterized protein (DUF1697 family)